MILNGILTAQVAATKTLLPSLRACRAHGGRFSLDDLAAVSVASPAVFIALLGTEAARENGTEEMVVPCQFAAYVVTTDAKDLSRDASAREIVEALLAWIPNQRFGAIDCDPPVLCGTPERVSAANLYDGQARGKAVALWAVSWTQTVLVGTSAFVNSGSLPDSVYVGGNPLEETL